MTGAPDPLEECTIRVTIDGNPVMVPKRVNSWFALRGVLGVARGKGIMVKSSFSLDETDPERDPPELNLRAPLLQEGWAILGPDEFDRPGEVVRFWEFSEGEEFRSMSINDLDGFDMDDEPLQPWQQNPDGWKEGE